MSEDEFDREVLDHVGVTRRTFVRRLVLGTAFAVPLLASFPMTALAADSAGAMTCNQGPLGSQVSKDARDGAGGDLGQELGGSAGRGNPPGKACAPGQQP